MSLEPHVVRPETPRSKAYIADLLLVGDTLYAVGGTYHEPTILASTDAVTFHKRKAPELPGLRCMVPILRDRLLVCGEYGGLFVSEDGAKSWTKIATGANACLFAIERDARGGLWVVGDDGFVIHSTDEAATWTKVDVGTTARISNVIADESSVFFACFDGSLLVHENGATEKLFTGTAALTDVARTKDGLFVTGDRGQLYRATSGTDFDRIAVVAEDVDLEAIGVGKDALFIVGSKGTVLRSADGRTFSIIETGVRSHFFSVYPTGTGAIVGGEAGALVHLRAPEDTTWTGKEDALDAEAGQLDAVFLDSAPETFLTTGLVTLVGPVEEKEEPKGRKEENGAEEAEEEEANEEEEDDGTPRDVKRAYVELQGGDRGDFQAVWGRTIPDEIDGFLKLAERPGNALGRVLYEVRPETELLPDLPPDKNLFELLVLRDQAAYLGTGLPELFSGQVCLGTYGNGDSHLVSVYSDSELATDDAPLEDAGDRVLHIFDHEEHTLAFETATSLSRFTYFAALCRAIKDQTISERAAKTCLERVRGAITPSWHFRSSIEEAGVEPFAPVEHARPYGRGWFFRCLWLVYLLRSDGVVDVDDVKRMFFPTHNPPLTDELHARWLVTARRLVPTALYVICRCFFFDDPHLEEYLAIGRDHRSRLVRDCARLVDDVLAGRKTRLGKIPDLLAHRARFQKLDLDPARAAARDAEAKERAAARDRARSEAKERVAAATDPSALAWSALHDVPLHEAIEARLRVLPALAPTFAAIDFVFAQGYVRENLVLSHEKDEEIEWLAQHGDAAIVPLLLGTLVRPKGEEPESEAEANGEKTKIIPITDAHPNHAGELLIAFARKGRLEARAAEALRPLLAIEEKYEWRRARAVELLGLLRDAESLAPIERLASELPTTDFGVAIRRGDLAVAIPPALARIGDARAVATLKTMLASNDRTAEKARSWTAMALAELGAIDTWKEILTRSADTERKPAAWLLWAVSELGARADDATKKEMVLALKDFAPKWNVFYLDLLKAGVQARLGSPPEDFAKTIETAFTKPGWDAETTILQEEWALRLVGVTDVDARVARPHLLRDHLGLRAAATEALSRRGEPVPPARLLHRAEVRRIEAEGGVAALIAALEDETAIYRHVVATRLGELRATDARPSLLRFARAQIAKVGREPGSLIPRDAEYPLRWSVEALLELGASAELTALLAEALLHPSREVKDPVLRYRERLPDDPALLEPMIHVVNEKYGWQESAANEWIEGMRKKDPKAYDDAIERARRG